MLNIIFFFLWASYYEKVIMVIIVVNPSTEKNRLFHLALTGLYVLLYIFIIYW